MVTCGSGTHDDNKFAIYTMLMRENSFKEISFHSKIRNIRILLFKGRIVWPKA